MDIGWTEDRYRIDIGYTQGEVRATWTSSPTTTPTYKSPAYTYTGQYSYSIPFGDMDDPTTSGVTEGFGLMFYNARWYDPTLGRFAQADTVIPGGAQGYDRYAYANNTPLNYTDPSGHDPSLNNCDYAGVDCPPPATLYPCNPTLPASIDGGYCDETETKKIDIEENQTQFTYYLSGSEVNKLVFILISGCTDCLSPGDFLSEKYFGNILEDIPGKVVSAVLPIPLDQATSLIQSIDDSSLQSIGAVLNTTYSTDQGYPDATITMKWSTNQVPNGKFGSVPTKSAFTVVNGATHDTLSENAGNKLMTLLLYIIMLK